jgi:hypothetical protein
MFTQSYQSAIRYIGEIAPSLKNATEFIKWAEDIADIMSFIYSKDYEDVTEDIVNAAKEEQGYEGEDEED